MALRVDRRPGNPYHSVMTSDLKKAFDAASRLPVEEQNRLAAAILEELASEERWAQSFYSNEQALAKLAREALNEHKSGETETLDPDTL